MTCCEVSTATKLEKESSPGGCCGVRDIAKFWSGGASGENMCEDRVMRTTKEAVE